MFFLDVSMKNMKYLNAIYVKMYVKTNNYICIVM